MSCIPPCQTLSFSLSLPVLAFIFHFLHQFFSLFPYIIPAYPMSSHLVVLLVFSVNLCFLFLTPYLTIPCHSLLHSLFLLFPPVSISSVYTLLTDLILSITQFLFPFPRFLPYIHQIIMSSFALSIQQAFFYCTCLIITFLNHSSACSVLFSWLIRTRSCQLSYGIQVIAFNLLPVFIVWVIQNSDSCSDI